MSAMFSYCFDFNQPLTDWNVSNVTNMAYMFSNCTWFDQYVFRNVPNVTNMEGMFYGCKFFNKPLERWNTSNVTTMEKMFSGSEYTRFNQSINHLNVSNVTNMNEMFKNCEYFNQPLNNWNVSNVTSMNEMFKRCERFNQPLNKWNVYKVNKMNSMFLDCKGFKQDISNWNVNPGVEYKDILKGTPLSNTFKTFKNIDKLISVAYQYFPSDTARTNTGHMPAAVSANILEYVHYFPGNSALKLAEKGEAFHTKKNRKGGKIKRKKYRNKTNKKCSNKHSKNNAKTKIK